MLDASLMWLLTALAAAILASFFLGKRVAARAHAREIQLAARGIFERYVSPDRVSQIAAHPELRRLGGVRKELTVMFTDLEGFTAMSETLGPEEVARVITEHLTRMTDIVFAHGGTIDKFIGDAVMAFWGAPLDDPDHALNAVRAALEMQREMDQLRRESEIPAVRNLRMRIGINTGPVVVGNLGSRARFDYTVVGDAVNLASRLESVNRAYGTGILMTEEVVARLRGVIHARPVDRVRVKGKRESIEIYMPTEDPTLAARSLLAFAAYRQSEWNRAEAVWQEVLAMAPGDGLATLYLERIAAHRHRDDADPDQTMKFEVK